MTDAKIALAIESIESAMRGRPKSRPLVINELTTLFAQINVDAETIIEALIRIERSQRFRILRTRENVWLWRVEVF